MNTAANQVATICEIDISRHSRALGTLRWSDYALVITCGMYARRVTLNLLVSAPEDEALVTAFQCAAIAILAFGAVQGDLHQARACALPM